MSFFAYDFQSNLPYTILVKRGLSRIKRPHMTHTHEIEIERIHKRIISKK